MQYVTIFIDVALGWDGADDNVDAAAASAAVLTVSSFVIWPLSIDNAVVGHANDHTGIEIAGGGGTIGVDKYDDAREETKVDENSKVQKNAPTEGNSMIFVFIIRGIWTKFQLDLSRKICLVVSFAWQRRQWIPSSSIVWGWPFGCT